MYEATQRDNLKLTGLGRQMVEMDQDFEEMMRMRNEAKKRLEEQFKDVYQKIKDNKQHTINEGRKVNESLKQFQDKFIELMNQLSMELTEQIRFETEYMESERQRGHDRLQYLEDLLAQERTDRIESLESQLVPVRQNLRKIEAETNQERTARVQKEREILETLQEESQKIENAINVEKEERQARQAELYAKVAKEIERENAFIERFQRETMAEFDKDRADIEKEMDNRFSHQDEIVRDIQHFITTFQKTLKANQSYQPLASYQSQYPNHQALNFIRQSYTFQNFKQQKDELENQQKKELFSPGKGQYAQKLTAQNINLIPPGIGKGLGASNYSNQKSYQQSRVDTEEDAVSYQPSQNNFRGQSGKRANGQANQSKLFSSTYHQNYLRSNFEEICAEDQSTKTNSIHSLSKKVSHLLSSYDRRAFQPAETQQENLRSQIKYHQTQKPVSSVLTTLVNHSNTNQQQNNQHYKDHKISNNLTQDESAKSLDSQFKTSTFNKHNAQPNNLKQQNLHDQQESSLVLQNSIEVMKDRLFWYCNRFPPKNISDSFFFNIDEILVYNGYNKDFGPLTLAQVHRYCTELKRIMRDEKYKAMKIFHHCSPHFQKQSNACFLLCAYLVVCHSYSPEQAWTPFRSKGLQLIPFRDAGEDPCTFECSVLDCIRGLELAISYNWYNYLKFDYKEYEYRHKLENGDINWIIPNKIAAFSSPSDNPKQGLQPKEFLNTFQAMRVRAVIRLNESLYDESVFENQGVRVYDMEFQDGSCPNEQIMETFISIVDAEISVGNAVAVHCRAGLGRTGTLIAAYILNKYPNFEAKSLIGWLRISRPGSVIGVQQQFLVDQQSTIKKLQIHQLRGKHMRTFNNQNHNYSSGVGVQSAAEIAKRIVQTSKQEVVKASYSINPEEYVTSNQDRNIIQQKLNGSKHIVAKLMQNDVLKNQFYNSVKGSSVYSYDSTVKQETEEDQMSSEQLQKGTQKFKTNFNYNQSKQQFEDASDNKLSQGEQLMQQRKKKLSSYMGDLDRILDSSTKTRKR